LRYHFGAEIAIFGAEVDELPSCSTKKLERPRPEKQAFRALRCRLDHEFTQNGMENALLEMRLPSDDRPIRCLHRLWLSSKQATDRRTVRGRRQTTSATNLPSLALVAVEANWWDWREVSPDCSL